MHYRNRRLIVVGLKNDEQRGKGHDKIFVKF
jgi:hypothetical protein